MLQKVLNAGAICGLGAGVIAGLVLLIRNVFGTVTAIDEVVWLNPEGNDVITIVLPFAISHWWNILAIILPAAVVGGAICYMIRCINSENLDDHFIYNIAAGSIIGIMFGLFVGLGGLFLGHVAGISMGLSSGLIVCILSVPVAIIFYGRLGGLIFTVSYPSAFALIFGLGYGFVVGNAIALILFAATATTLIMIDGVVTIARAAMSALTSQKNGPANAEPAG